MIQTEPNPSRTHVQAHEGDNSEGQLRSIVERAENLHQQRADLADDLKELFGEARANGFDVKAIKAVIKYRAEDKAKRAEFDAILTTYLAALGEPV